MSELVRRYAEASIVAVCERLRIDTVVTLNRRAFDNLQPTHRPALTIVQNARVPEHEHGPSISHGMLAVLT